MIPDEYFVFSFAVNGIKSKPYRGKFSVLFESIQRKKFRLVFLFEKNKSDFFTQDSKCRNGRVVELGTNFWIDFTGVFASIDIQNCILLWTLIASIWFLFKRQLKESHIKLYLFFFSFFMFGSCQFSNRTRANLFKSWFSKFQMLNKFAMLTLKPR